MAASRIANVSAVLRTERGTASAAGGATRGAGALCRALFEEVVEIAREGGVDGGSGDATGGSGPQAGLAAALAAVSGERVLVVEAAAAPALEAEVVLALVAWPEADAIVPVDRAGVDLPFGLYRREACRARLDELAARGGPIGRDALEAALGVERVALAALGLEGPAVAGAPPSGAGG